MIKLAKPYITEDCINDVIDVLRSGNFVQGKNVQKLEETIKAYLGVKNAVVVSSCTAALHLALLTLGIGPGDEVIVPAFTFPATTNMVECVGAKNVLVDINLDDFCINTSLIEGAITSKTKAILPVHEFGQAAKMDKVMEISEKYGLKVIEDAACALGTEYNGKKVGTFGDIGCFSLHPRKAITSGEGGILVTNNEDLTHSMSILRNHGIENHTGSIDFVIAGYNYRMTDFQAALCLPQLDIIEHIIEERICQAENYNNNFKEIKILTTPHVFSDRKMVYQTYHIILDKKFDRNIIIKRLKEKEIETNYGAYAINILSYYSKNYGYKPNDYPNAVFAFEQGLALPIGMHVQGCDILKITSELKGLLS
ncbi:MAG: DegT/DnrJ/EryC1/StrS family aminotransferase [Methanobrevibacter sp.]|nr:DegT/DnrJ/EryC1/StrS family aminotransferase [Methanobrevibacter sp.]